MQSCLKSENQGEKLQKKHRKPMYRIIDGVPRCPRLNPDDFRKTLQFRPGAGDLLQSTFPKSGTHWMMYIVQLILRNGEQMESYQEFLYGWRYLEYMDIEGWQSPLPLRAFMTHLPLSEVTFSPEAKYIYVARNPWDVCVSFYHMAKNLSLYQYEDATFEEFVDAFVDGNFGYGDFFEHVAAAYDLKEKPNVLFVTYEEMKENTKGVFLKVARFLGERYGRALAADEPLLNELLNRSGAEFMRDKVVVDFRDFPNPNCTELSEKSYLFCKEGYEGDKTKYSFVRSAKVGGWKQHFTPHLLGRMEERIREAEKKTSFMDLWKDIRTEAINLMAVP